MNKFFYPKLAATNLKKNSKTYVPYIITCICTVMMFYMMYTLSVNQGLDKMKGGDSLKILLSLGNYVIGIFAVIFLTYTNSFLIKRRKKEFGLFNILGMEKRHLSIIMFYETIYVSVISLVIGILGGIALSKIMFLILLKILDFRVQMGFFISIKGIITSLLLFGGIFFFTLLNNMRQIHLANPIELLKGGNLGEKEPKTKWLLVLIGVLSLGGGYYISLTTENPMKAIYLFFVAVILVIIGTYCLFTAGSIALLKMFRKNKSYYYKTKHFISVSGMIYRMKQNAVGLANICILSTMVLVMLSTTVSLYVGMEDIIAERYPRQIMLTTKESSKENNTVLSNRIDEVLKKNDVAPKNSINYMYFDIIANLEGTKFNANQEEIGQNYGGDSFSYVTFLPLEDYNRMIGEKSSLEDNEVLIYATGKFSSKSFTIFDKTYQIKDEADKKIIDLAGSNVYFNNYYVVVKDYAVLKELVAAFSEVNSTNEDNYYNQTISSYYGFDTEVSSEDVMKIYEELKNDSDKLPTSTYVESSVESKESFLAIYGGLFFLGIFLGALFMMATILIIYYKQISEGYDDKERFQIMQKVGLSKEEVKKTIHSQVLTVFFLPLFTAVIHIAFAFPVITRLLAMLNLTNVTLFGIFTGITILIFAIVYGIVYSITAREYYKIVW
jgi:putative ABC transport system permease protein